MKVGEESILELEPGRRRRDNKATATRQLVSDNQATRSQQVRRNAA